LVIGERRNPASFHPVWRACQASSNFGFRLLIFRKVPPARTRKVRIRKDEVENDVCDLISFGRRFSGGAWVNRYQLFVIWKRRKRAAALRVIGYLLVVIRGAKKTQRKFEKVLIESASE